MDFHELNNRSLRLLRAQQQILKTSRWRPRKAAKMLCAEFGALGADEDFWDTFADAADKLQGYGDPNDGPLTRISSMVALEADLLGRLGVDQCDIGHVLSNVFDALDLAKARQQNTAAPAIRNLRDRVSDAGGLICKYERGPLLQTADYMLSKKGARALGAVGLGGLNAALAMNGELVSASASIKAAVSVADGDISDLSELLEVFFKDS